MPQFAVELNRDSLGRLTSARYDTSAAKWLSDVAMHTKNAAGLWVPVSEIDPMPAKLTGNKLEEQKTQADAVGNVITFTGDISAVEIYHKEPSWQDFIVNGITLKIPAGGYRTPIGGVVAKTVTIPPDVNCIVGRLA